MDKKPAKKRKLPNARQQALVKNLAKGMNQTDAYREAGYDAKHAPQAAHLTVNRIAKTWPEMLEKVVGTPESVIAKYILPLMNANETKTALDQKTGQFRYSKPMKAWGPRYNGLDIYCRIAGAYQREQEATPLSLGVKVIIVDAPRPARGVVMADVGPGELPPSTKDTQDS